MKKANTTQYQLTPEELEIQAYFDEHLDELEPPTASLLDQMQQIATNTIKAKNINMRVRPNDLEALKQKAKEAGIGYQTILTALIRQYVAGKIKLEL